MPLFDPGIPATQKGEPHGVATLDASGKIPAAELEVSSKTYKGTWDASANTPTLADGSGTAGDEYIADVAGTQDLGSGSQTFAVGDAVVYNGTAWEKSPAGYPVTEVNGKVGAVTLAAEDVGAVKLGGQAPSGSLTFGTTNNQGFTILLDNNPFIVTNSIGNMSINTGTAPSVPFMVGGGMWTQAGGVIYGINPDSGTDVSVGTSTNHPVNLIANGSTALTIGTNGHLTAGGGYTPSAAKDLATKDYVDSGGPINRTSGTTQLELSGAELLWPNTILNGKIRLFDTTPGSDHTFYGFGIQSEELIYQVDSSISDHVFMGQSGTDTGVELFRAGVNSGFVSSVDFQMSGKLITGLGAPLAATDAATKGYVDGILPSWSEDAATNDFIPANTNAQNIGHPGHTVRHVLAESFVVVPNLLVSSQTPDDDYSDEIFMDCTGGNVTVAIDGPNCSSGKRFFVKKIDSTSNTCTVSIPSGTIDGAASVVLSTQWQFVELRMVNPDRAFIIGKG